MVKLSVEQIVAATNARLLHRGTREVAGAAVIDSREVQEGSLFVAFAGEKVNGNSYLLSAAQAGAAVVVASEPVADNLLDNLAATGVSVLEAADDDCEAFLLALAASWREAHPNWLVVGVTGSVGKTTTKEMLRRGIGATRRVHATAGNHNNLIGLPLTVLSTPEDTEVLVLELGMNHAGEIIRLTSVARPTVAVITNVGTSHIGLLGSRENIARAKAEIVSGMRAFDSIEPTLIQASAGDYTKFIADEFARPAHVVCKTVGATEADVMSAQQVTLDEEGLPTATIVAASGWSRTVTLEVPGRVVIDDLLLALEVIETLGLDLDAAAEAIEQMPATRMRLSVLDATCGAKIIDDSYNASPNSTAAALDVLMQMPAEGRRIALIGEIGELGPEEKRLHGYVGAYIAAKNPDLVAFIGTGAAREMVEAARVMGFSEDKIEQFSDVNEALTVLGPVLAQGDVLLAKASRSAQLDIFVKGVTE